MYEDKCEICDHLCACLQATREDIVDLEYVSNCDNYKEAVIVTYGNGFQLEVNVSGDSGVALIKDVAQAIARH